MSVSTEYDSRTWRKRRSVESAHLAARLRAISGEKAFSPLTFWRSMRSATCQSDHMAIATPDERPMRCGVRRAAHLSGSLMASSSSNFSRHLSASWRARFTLSLRSAAAASFPRSLFSSAAMISCSGDRSIFRGIFCAGFWVHEKPFSLALNPQARGNTLNH